MSRRKTTVTLPFRMLVWADEYGRQIGVGRNGFISLSLAMSMAQLAKIFEFPKKRRQLLTEIEEEFQILLKEAKRNA